MLKKLALPAILIILIVSAVVCLPKVKESRAFRSAVEAESQDVAQRETAISLYKAYLQNWPEGKYSETARSKVIDLENDQVRDEFAKGLSEVLRTKEYGKAIAALSKDIAANPENQMARLRRAYLTWGFDRFDRDSWQASLQDIEVVLEQNGVGYVDSNGMDNKPIVRLAAAIMNHSTGHQPIEPPATSPEFRHLRTIKASNIVEFYAGAAAILPGQTATFGDDGKMIVLEDGSHTYKN